MTTIDSYAAPAGADNIEGEPSTRIGGRLAIAGVAAMVAGAICHSAFGADLWKVMVPTDRAGASTALTEVARHHRPLVIGSWLWIIGACTMCIGGTVIVRRSTGVWATVSRWAFATAAGACVVFFTAMMAIGEVLAPAHARGEDVVVVAETIGYAASAADAIATVLILTVGFGSIVLSGHRRWAPRWLVGLVAVNAVAATASLIVYRTGGVVANLIVPIGLATVVGAAVTEARRAH